MGTRKVKFTKDGIGDLPDDKPVLYRIRGRTGTQNYVGTAKKGRVQERLTEHLPGAVDHIPGATIEIQQFSSITDAQKKETNVIKRVKPPHNKQGK